MRCRRSLAVGLLAGLVALTSPVRSADVSGGSVATPPLAIFVGRLLSIEEVDTDCGEDCAPFDSGYVLVYQPLTSMDGGSMASPVRVQFFGHYGLPSFARFDTALLFVFRGERQDVLARYLGFPVAETVDGRWAYCGDTHPDDTPPRDRSLARITFAREVEATDAQIPQDDAGHRFSGRDAMRPGVRHCAAGMHAEDLVRLHGPDAEPGYLRVWQF